MNSPSTQPLNTRQEVILFAAILVLGIALRMIHLDRVAVEHFDEGVYASNVFFEEQQHFRYPDRHLYAPPLLPTLLELTHFVFGTGSLGLMLPSLLSGCLTMVVAHRMGKHWFGQAAGFGVMLLIALNDVHLLYSRTMLTDVLLAFWILMAVQAWARAAHENSLRWAAKAGLYTALAWWTKYNGWLPLAIVASGTLAWWVLERKWKTTPAGGLAKSFGVMLLVAGLLWVPVWRGLQDFGGYAAVSANHARYIVGFSGWFESLAQQFQKQRVLTDWLTVLSVLLGLGMVFLPVVKPLLRSGRRTSLLFSQPILISVGVILLLAGLTAWWGGYPTLALTAIAGILFRLAPLWPRREPVTPSSLPRHDGLMVWLVAAWFCGLLLATPLYFPYPRLTLPWLIAACLGTAAFIQCSAGWLNRQVSYSSGGFSIAGGLALLLGLGVFLVGVVIQFPRWQDQGVAAWQPRTSFREMAPQILEQAAQESKGQSSRPEIPFVIYVYAEPGLFYYLRANYIAVAPAGTLSVFSPEVPQPYPTFLLIGPHGQQMLENDPVWKEHPEVFELVEEYTYHPSLLVRLDERIEGFPPPEPQPVRLYCVK